MEATEIHGDGLFLRPWRREDANDVYRACQDPDIQRYTGVPSPYLLEHAIGFVDKAPHNWATGTGAPFAVCDAETGELLGSAGLVTVDHVLGSGEVGYWTAPWARGRGIAVRAAPGSLVARRAAVYGHGQPILAAKAPGGEIRLRPPFAGDVPAIVTTARDAETVRWTGVPDPYRPSDAEYFVGPYADGRWGRGEGAVFAIADATDAYVGSIELRVSPDDPSVADVAFMVSPAARGLGYAPAALRALCSWGFDALGLERIEWLAYVGNTASRAVAEKAGFTLEGVRRRGWVQRGPRRDVWVAALLPGDVAAAMPGPTTAAAR